MLFIVSEGSDRVPPENFPSTQTLTILSPDAVVLIQVTSVTPKILDTEHVIVWLCPPTTSAFVGAMRIEGLPVKENNSLHNDRNIRTIAK
jgi:hypothetical protein